MFRIQALSCCMLLVIAAGCKAQTPAPAPQVDRAQVNRRVEIQVRSQFNVPPTVDVKIGEPVKSDLPGYNTLPVTFTQGARSSTVEFLLSTDGKTLAKLDKFDISKSPEEIVSSANRPERGSADAKVVIVNFDDLECPYCAQMHHELFPATLDRYKGLVKIVYKDYPLVDIHPWAMHAAINANCLAAQNTASYWTYVDYLHAHGQDVSGPDRDAAKATAALDKLAKDQGATDKLDAAKLDACISKQDASVVQGYMKEGEKLGVTGTPTMFINGERLEGWKPQEQIWQSVDRALKAAGVQPPPMPPATEPAAKPAGEAAKPGSGTK